MKIEIVQLAPVKWQTYAQTYSFAVVINGHRMSGSFVADATNLGNSIHKSMTSWMENFLVYDESTKKCVSGTELLIDEWRQAIGEGFDLVTTIFDIVEAAKLAVLKYRISQMPQHIKNAVIYGLNQPEIVS